jgi:hypothetical protein
VTAAFLFIFALGFSGCQFISELLGLDTKDHDTGVETGRETGEENKPADTSVSISLYVQPGTAGGDGTKGHLFATMQDALDEVTRLYAPGNSNWPGKGTAEEKSATIILLDKIAVDTGNKIEISGAGAYPPLIFCAEGTAGSEPDMVLKTTGTLITVGQGVKLTLRNIILQGFAHNNAPLITVNGDGAELVIETGAVIKGNHSTFTKNGGGGGGVFVTGKAALTMNGGEISGNNVIVNGGGGGLGGGGGVYLFNATNFTMAGGKISGNSVTVSDLGRAGGGGVRVFGSTTFTMTDGEISNNTVYNDSFQVDYGIGRTIGFGGGVAMKGLKFIMTGGTITGNTADDYGGGVLFSDGEFTMTGSAVINYNSAGDYGGGVGINGGTFTVSGGTIASNKVGTFGGGVGVASTGTFTKESGGIIYGDKDAPDLQNSAGGTGVNVTYYGHAVGIKSDTSEKYHDSKAGENFRLNSEKEDNWDYSVR